MLFHVILFILFVSTHLLIVSISDHQLPLTSWYTCLLISQSLCSLTHCVLWLIDSLCGCVLWLIAYLLPWHHICTHCLANRLLASSFNLSLVPTCIWITEVPAFLSNCPALSHILTSQPRPISVKLRTKWSALSILFSNPFFRHSTVVLPVTSCMFIEVFFFFF